MSALTAPNHQSVRLHPTYGGIVVPAFDLGRALGFTHQTAYEVSAGYASPTERVWIADPDLACYALTPKGVQRAMRDHADKVRTRWIKTVLLPAMQPKAPQWSDYTTEDLHAWLSLPSGVAKTHDELVYMAQRNLNDIPTRAEVDRTLASHKRKRDEEIALEGLEQLSEASSEEPPAKKPMLTGPEWRRRAEQQQLNERLAVAQHAALADGSTQCRVRLDGMDAAVVDDWLTHLTDAAQLRVERDGLEALVRAL